MLDYELSLFDIERIDVEGEKSLESVDLHDFLLVESQLFCQGIELGTLEVVNVEEQ